MVSVGAVRLQGLGFDAGLEIDAMKWVARTRMTMQTRGILWTQAPFLIQEDGMAIALDNYLGHYLKEQLSWVVEGALPESAKPEWMD